MFRLFTGLSLVITLASNGFAVWPPSTLLETAPRAPAQMIEISTISASGRLSVVVQKLEDDERRLTLVIDSLEQRDNMYKESSMKTSPIHEPERPR